MNTALVVHGGAGNWTNTNNQRSLATAVCVDAVHAGQIILQNNGDALDAVEAAVIVLENSPVLDAGRGSFLNAQGEIQMDALMMDGATLNLGAVAAVQRIKNPIRLAHALLHYNDHNFLVGEGAETFAQKVGIEFCAHQDLITDENFKDYQKRRGNSNETLHSSSLSDTVGAVALDMHGNLAVATSTGGTRHKLPGRVGDSPLVGSGGYADNSTAAVSATGDGESLMKVVISKQVCDFINSGLSAQEACDSAIRLLEDRVQGHGGLISIDHRGQIGIAFNTHHMPNAYQINNNKILSGN
ncbi:MAG: isoaspartyl peptidase/L-asparaginase [Chloroflexota bacterium]